MRNATAASWVLRLVLCLIFVAAACVPRAALATFYNGSPGNYQTLIDQLQPGDTLQLAPGTYTRLTLAGVHGTPSGWITVLGVTPVGTGGTVIHAESGYNTVQLADCSYLAVGNLYIDGLNLGTDGINAKDGICHDIRVENCTLVGYGDDQSTVGISTKVVTWNWTIRGNTLIQPGTGLYLGNSPGDCPFINGVIEGNYVKDPIGYCMEIKQQNNYSWVTGMPAGPNRTIVRNNVFEKDSTPSPAGDRPNLLLDPFPTSGQGSQDMYEVYGNLLYNNPRESLFQGCGRISFHDNVLVAPAIGDFAAIYMTNHDGTLDYATIYNNTIYGTGPGIIFTNAPTTYGAVFGNLVLSDTPITLCGSCGSVVRTNNVTDAVANAGSYVNQPSTTLGAMDFYPKTTCAACSGSALDVSAVSSDPDYALDFNGTSKGSFTYRGAYAGSGSNPGWPLQDEPKVGGPSSGTGGGIVDVIPPSPPQGLHVR
jgi:hypothetical protein